MSDLPLFENEEHQALLDDNLKLRERITCLINENNSLRENVKYWSSQDREIKLVKLIELVDKIKEEAEHQDNYRVRGDMDMYRILQLIRKYEDNDL